MRRTHITQTQLNEEQLDVLVERSRHGDTGAWADLWLALAPFLERIAGCRRVTGRLAASPDERSNIVARIMGELRDDGARRLAELGERLACRDGSWRRWLTRVARNSAISHVREHAEYLGQVKGEGGRWARLLPLSEALEDERFDPTVGIEVRDILSYARENLEPAQLGALCRWMEDRGFDRIACELHLTGSDEAARLVRSAVERLRARFAAGEKKRRSRRNRLMDRPKKASVKR